MRNGSDNFSRWLARQPRRAVLAFLLAAVLAAVGLVDLLDRAQPCRLAQGCNPNAEPFHDPW